MTGGPERPGRVGDVGPPEPDGDSTALTELQISEADGLAVERRLSGWWRGLPRPVRRGLLAAAGLGAAAALILTAVSDAPPHRAGPAQPPAPAPWPAQVTDVYYAGLAPGNDPRSSRFVFLLSIADLDRSPVTIHHIAQPYAGLSVTTEDPLPIGVAPGESRIVRVLAEVRDCARTPERDDLPFLDVTLSNARAIQTQSEILGGSYSDDLGREIAERCGRTPASLPPAPSTVVTSPG
ncbi:hypothetical protein [Streptacidiphilus carbonis]|jgi:hypothetical protein|uniref:hypothetical protein n=1 Tax=Streptacidiphilus carbonis TaxID=105422 RepID=UPI0006932F5A|nr:hypothetical protein [Streptacidiphilus carbonis]